MFGLKVVGFFGIAAAVFSIAGCGSSQPLAAPSTVTSVETDTMATTVTATVPTTVTSVETKTATKTVTSVAKSTVTKRLTSVLTTTATVTATSTIVRTAVAAATSLSAPSAPISDSGSSTDQASVLIDAGRVVDDVKEADQRIASGDNSGVSTTMSFLSTDFSDLQSDGAPPGSQAAQYLATCGTESNFADLASNEFLAGNDSDGVARYQVMRQHVNEVLTVINTGYGTHYSV